MTLGPILAIAGSVVTAFLLSAIIFYKDGDNAMEGPAEFWSVLLMSGAYFSAFASMPTIAILSGSVLATERADRSIEFLLILPPTRRQIFVSKLILVSGLYSATLWVIVSSIAISHTLAGASNLAATIAERFPSIQWFAAANYLAVTTGLSTSCFSKNAAPCALLALFSPLALQIGLLLVQKKMGLLVAVDALYVFSGSCILIGSLILFVGWGYFERCESL
jgi:hypothetical protein